MKRGQGSPAWRVVSETESKASGLGLALGTWRREERRRRPSVTTCNLFRLASIERHQDLRYGLTGNPRMVRVATHDGKGVVHAFG